MLGMRTCSRNANWIRANIPKSCHKPLVSLLYATKSAFTALNVCCACALDHVMQIGFGQISPSASSTRDLGTRLVRFAYHNEYKVSLYLYPKTSCCLCTPKLPVDDNHEVKADFQSVLRTLESLFTACVLFHVRHHKM